ncbi:hypothetical protein V1514DRAFT_352808 [Lipomyces japonicus]|uniref:uncharacterized protein n=1 Tax=Lipomyces japonicus TaxID=56871 RepID=UPI0034CD6EC7
MTDFDANKYLPMINAILRVADLEEITVKRIRNALQELFNIDLGPNKKEIDNAILTSYRELQDELDTKNEQQKPRRQERTQENKKVKVKKETREQDGQQRGVATKKRKQSSSTSSQHHGDNGSNDETQDEGKDELTKKKRRPTPQNSYNADLFLSPELSNLLGGIKALPRPQVTKQIWKYVRDHDLQDPADKRYINCDKLMRAVFGPRVHCFHIAKTLSQHLFKKDEVVVLAPVSAPVDGQEPLQTDSSNKQQPQEQKHSGDNVNRGGNDGSDELVDLFSD